jgi:L-aminopeptidase/D-esterase-like protein
LYLKFGGFMRPGPLNLITDVPGILVGHATDERAVTGVTTVVAETHVVGGVDVRGGAPGVRETDTLAPEALVDQVHAIVLAGGSVFGLGAADGVATTLSNAGRGLRILSHTRTIPIVPAAVLHDLGGPGDKNWQTSPYPELGVASVLAAERDFALGAIGAGRGARAGKVPGGIGSASLDLGDGLIVGALVAVNSIGSAYLPDGRTFYAWPYEQDGEFGGHRSSEAYSLRDPAPPDSRLADMAPPQPGTSTVIAVVATSAQLGKADCKRLAVMAQDGIARAIRPSHTPFDGDTVFAIATGKSSVAANAALVARLGSAAADCLCRAIARGVHAASQS